MNIAPIVTIIWLPENFNGEGMSESVSIVSSLLHISIIARNAMLQNTKQTNRTVHAGEYDSKNCFSG